MRETLLVGMGGFLGAPCRYFISKCINKYWRGNYPLATFMINVFGSLLLGLLVFHFKQPAESNANLFFGVGFLGSFTTFSTFQYENLGLLKEGKVITAAAYTLLSFVIGIALAFLAVII